MPDAPHQESQVPPSDIDAEAVVLSSILLEPEKLSLVAAFLKPHHFYATQNGRIYAAVTELDADGKTIDNVSVAGLLRDRDQLQQVGGTPYIAQLTDATPATAHLESHARRVVREYDRRRIIIECKRIAAETYGDVGDIDDWKQEVDARIQEITQSSDPDKHLVLIGEATKETIQLVHHRKQHKGVILTGVTTGLPTLDARMGGLEVCKKYVVAARPGMGKAQPLSAKVLTPSGWTTMGELKVGDIVVDADGGEVRVKRIFERRELPVYRVTMVGGGSTLCCNEHLWLTRTFADRCHGRVGCVRPLHDLRATLRTANDGINHTIPGFMGAPERFIQSIEASGNAICRCIEIDSLHHLYVTDDYIVTHNTALATGIVLAVAKGQPRAEEATDGVVFISIEMPRIQIVFRMLSQLSRIDSVKIQRGQLTDLEFEDVRLAADKLARLPIAIEDSSDHTPASIRAAYRQGQRKLQERHGKKCRVKLVGIDYLQLMGGERQAQNREAEISSISRATKAMAKNEGIAVLELAQVNRDCEKRPGDKRPILADLRESGSIEQDADVVLFVYRDDVYRKDDDEKDNKAELIVRKLRDNGGPGTVHCEFHPTTMSFYEKSRDPDIAQLGDMFDDYLPGQSGEPVPEDWHQKYDK